MAHDENSLAEDWVTLWQSELAALAADRELRESWIGLLALMANTASLVIQQAGQSGDPARQSGQPANGASSAAQPARPAPAASASEFGADEARRLNERIADLESRLSAFEHRKRGKPVRPGST